MVSKMALNYVKFQRGSLAAYNNLKLRNKLEPDALYFIYDEEHPEAGGLLYLGAILIGGSGNNVGSISLNDLSDIVITDPDNLIDGMILQYNSNLHTWYPVSIKQAITNSQALPTVTSINKENGKTPLQTLNNLTNVIEGNIVFIDNIPYIYNGKEWQLLVGNSIEDRLSAIENDIETLQNTILDANHLTYIVKDTLPNLDDTLEDLSNKVILVPNNSQDTQNNNQYDEFMLINGTYERLGSWNVNLNDYVRVEELDNYATKVNLNDYLLTSTFNDYQSQVGNISQLLIGTDKENTTIVDEIIDVRERLKWQPITE